MIRASRNAFFQFPESVWQCAFFLGGGGLSPQTSARPTLRPEHGQPGTGSVAINAMSPRRHCLKAPSRTKNKTNWTHHQTCRSVAETSNEFPGGHDASRKTVLVCPPCSVVRTRACASLARGEVGCACARSLEVAGIVS